MIRAEQLCFSYRHTPILRDLSFTVKKGSCTAILGPNGAGKSTLLRILDRLAAPRSGQVFLDGKAISSISPAAYAKRVAYLPQTVPTGDLTVFDTVLLGRKPHMRIYPTNEDIRRTGDVLDAYRLSHLATRPLYALSGGERQKVAIAAALARDPELLLLDEPTASLDLAAEMQTAALIRQIASDQNRTVILSLHNLSLALQIADSFLFLKDGRCYATVTRACITSELIRDVYGVNVSIHQANGQTVILPNRKADI